MTNKTFLIPIDHKYIPEGYKKKAKRKSLFD